MAGKENPSVSANKDTQRTIMVYVKVIADSLYTTHTCNRLVYELYEVILSINEASAWSVQHSTLCFLVNCIIWFSKCTFSWLNFQCEHTTHTICIYATKWHRIVHKCTNWDAPSLSLRCHAHGPLAKRLMHMAHLSGNTSGVSKSSSDWLNYTGFPGDVCVSFSNVPPGNKNAVAPNPLMKEESCRVYNCDDERLSGSNKRWIFKSMWNI